MWNFGCRCGHDQQSRVLRTIHLPNVCVKFVFVSNFELPYIILLAQVRSSVIASGRFIAILEAVFCNKGESLGETVSSVFFLQANQKSKGPHDRLMTDSWPSSFIICMYLCITICFWLIDATHIDKYCILYVHMYRYLQSVYLQNCI